MPAAKKIRQTTREIVTGFGAAVRAERERQGITGGELARRAGCSPTAVSEVEREVRAVSLALAVRLARALDVLIGDLTPDARPRTPAAR